jgi:hypothetical protein
MNMRFCVPACLAVLLCLGSCGEKLSIGTPQAADRQEEGFTLTATYGSPDTKVAFDEDGLNLSWQPGDCLYLVDVSGKNSTVTMKTDITAPSKKASFRSTSSVLSGEYIVLYGQSNLYVSKSVYMKSGSALNEQIRLYGTLTVEDGQTAASISLSHLFSMLTFKFKNVPTLTNMKVGMAVTEDGMPSFSDGKISQTGVSTDGYVFSQNIRFGWNQGKEGKSLVIPQDFSGKTVYFYVYGDANGQHITYEFVKSGKNLCAGVNNNLTFDFAQAASVCTLEQSSIHSGAYVLTTPAHFRAASYWDSHAYSVESDVDFTGEACFPISATTLFGNKHTLSNITINLKDCSRVGLVSSGSVQDLTVENITVTGNEYVGGLVAQMSYNHTVSQCVVKGVVDISGQTWTGGITGQSANISQCVVKGTVSVWGDHYVGGIAGVGNTGDIQQCGFEGNVSGAYYVGGIVGSGGPEQCYVYGNVTGTGDYVGGVSGRGDCRNCYHIGDTTDEKGQCGGISGNNSSWSNASTGCYSYGTTSSGYGIAYNLSSSYTGKNLTSASAMGKTATYAENCNCGPGKTFLSKLSVINGEEAYSTQVWKGIDAQCPLLQWQAAVLNGEIDIPGFGDEEW